MNTFNKVLITGICGFTGQYLREYLSKKGLEVFGLSHAKHVDDDHLFTCDLADTAEIDKILEQVQADYIIHLAAISNVAHANPLDFYSINTLGTENLLSSIQKLKRPPKKLILASTSAVYGAQASCHELLSESIAPKPVNHYGLSKFAMEQRAQVFNNLDIIILRPFNYTGPKHHENFIIPKIVKHYAEGAESIELGNLNVEREFNDISFACEVYFRLLTQNVKPDTYNLCSGRLIHLENVITLMNEMAGYSIELKVNEKFVRKDEIFRLRGCSKKLFSAIGPVQQPKFIETLENMYTFYKKT